MDTLFTKRFIRSAFLCGILTGSLQGCGDATTRLLDPQSNMFLMQITPVTPETTIELDTDKVTVKTITFEEIRADFGINNGVSAYIEGIDIRYFDQFGKEVVNPLLAQSYGLNLLVQAPNVVTRGTNFTGTTGSTGGGSSSGGSTGGGSTGSGSSSGGSTGGGTGTSAKISAAFATALPGTAGSVNIPVMNRKVLTFITNNTFSTQDDDTSPLQARINFRVRDVNGNQFSITGSVRLDNRLVVKEGDS